MSKPEWGIKRVCPSCSIKYYDFNKNPIICPKCEFEFDPDLLLKSRKGRSIASKTEDNTTNVSQKENEPLDEDINTIENDQEILEIDDVETNLENEDINVNLEENVEKDISGDDIESVDKNQQSKEDEFSIEINEEDEEDDNVENDENK